MFFALIRGPTPNLRLSVFRGLCEQMSGFVSKSTLSIDSSSQFLFHMEQMSDHTKSSLLLSEPMAQANEIEIFLDGGVG